eukprot:m51a1_g11177 hypothetical protein (595) ;mRNA; f:318838-330938
MAYNLQNKEVPTVQLEQIVTLFSFSKLHLNLLVQMGAGAKPRVQESLKAAWELRESVVGHVADAADLCSLALALPSALCAPCFRRLPLFCAPVPCALPRCRAPHSPAVALAVCLAGRATPEALGQLARRCPGLSRALALPIPCGPCGLCGLCCALAAVCRSPCGHPRSLGLLASLPGLPPEALASATAGALRAACGAGGARAALLLGELSRPPLCAQEGGWHPLSEALRAACRSGSVEALRVLRTEPFGAVLQEHADEVRSTRLLHEAEPEEDTPYELYELEELSEDVLSEACRSGSASAAVLEELACPLYVECLSLSNIMAKAQITHITCDDVDVLRRLSLPPFFLGHREKLETPLPLVICTGVALLDVFASELFSINVPVHKADLLLRFDYACKSRSARPLRRLALPPYCLGHTEAIARSCDSLRMACEAGSSEPFDALAEPPYSLTHGDALCSRVLQRACACGNAAAVQRLAQPPYCLGREEACEDNCEVLREACQRGRVDVIEELARAPYSLGRTEARAAGALKTACRFGSAYIVRALAQRPFSLGHWDACHQGNLCLFMACMNGNAVVVQMLAEPPYSLGFGHHCKFTG